VPVHVVTAFVGVEVQLLLSLTQVAGMVNSQLQVPSIDIDMIYLLTAIGLSPGGTTHLHTNNT